MTDKLSDPAINKKYIAVFALAVLLSWELHELCHWMAGEYLGYKMVMTINSGYLVDGKYAKDMDYQLISAAGPLFTMLEALLVFILMIRRKRILLYPFLFTCFYMRLLATAVSFGNPNDEARISTAIGIGKFTLPVIVTGILFVLVYRISKRYAFSTAFNLKNLGLVILFTSIIILTDMFLKVRLI